MSEQNLAKPILTVDELFDWMRLRQPDGKLSQEMVDITNDTLNPIAPAQLQKLITVIGTGGTGLAAVSPDTKPKYATRAAVKRFAHDLGIEPAKLAAVIEVECPKSGFGADGKPTILFEPHVYYKYLTRANIITKRDQLQALFPDMVSKNWDRSLYNVRPSHDKLAVAQVLDWDAAHMACSWGAGQVMGFNWELLGYPSLKTFIDKMHESEDDQIEAMCRFIKVNGLVPALKRGDWAAFAKGYNGEGYAVHKYDTRLDAAHTKALKNGW